MHLLHKLVEHIVGLDNSPILSDSQIFSDIFPIKCLTAIVMFALDGCFPRGVSLSGMPWHVLLL